jgi:hypothetical protein
MALRILEKKGRSAPPEDAITDFRHLQFGTDGHPDPAQFTTRLELRQKIPEIPIFHVLCLELAADTIITGSSS